MAQRPPPSAAAALYPNLKSDERPRQQQRAGSLAEAMYPRPQARPPSSDREILLKNLRELNRAIDQRMSKQKEK